MPSATIRPIGYALNVIPNPDLRWEISSTLNLGMDFGLLNDRLTGSLEVYKTNTTDLLLNRLIPITSGYESILQNIGATSNQGWELSLNGNILRSPDGFKWDANLNLFSNKEKIVELFNGKDDVGNQWFIGQPVSVFYNFKQEGIWQTSEADEAAKVKQKPGDVEDCGRERPRCRGKPDQSARWRHQLRRPDDPGLYGTQVERRVHQSAEFQRNRLLVSGICSTGTIPAQRLS